MPTPKKLGAPIHACHGFAAPDCNQGSRSPDQAFPAPKPHCRAVPGEWGALPPSAKPAARTRRGRIQTQRRAREAKGPVEDPLPPQDVTAGRDGAAVPDDTFTASLPGMSVTTFVGK